MSRPAGGQPDVGIVFDHTALAAMGTSRIVAARVVEAHDGQGTYIYVPALCLAAAVAVRPQLADHVGQLPALEVVDLDYPLARTVGALIGAGSDWQAAHAIATARPSPDWPAGRPVLTRVPAAYDGWDVTTLTLPD